MSTQAAGATRHVTEVQAVTTPRGARFYDVIRSTWGPSGVIAEPPLHLMSVTTLLSRGLPKPWLIGWKARTVGELAIEMAEEIVSLKAKGLGDTALEMLKREPDRKRDLAGDLGTAVHQVIDRLGQADSEAEVRLVLEQTPQEVRLYVVQAVDFLTTVRPRILHQEAAVWSERWWYAGRTDLICEIASRRSILDWKTGGVYAEAALQLAAYRWAEWVLPRGATEPIKMADLGLDERWGWVLDLKPESWRLHDLRIDETVHRVFLNVRTVGQRWRYELEDRVMGPYRDGAAPITNWQLPDDEGPLAGVGHTPSDAEGHTPSDEGVSNGSAGVAAGAE